MMDHKERYRVEGKTERGWIEITSYSREATANEDAAILTRAAARSGRALEYRVRDAGPELL